MGHRDLLVTHNLSERKYHHCSHHPRGSVRRASGFVLTGNSDTNKLGKSCRPSGSYLSENATNPRDHRRPNRFGFLVVTFIYLKDELPGVLKEELQSQLDFTCWLRGLNVVENLGRRTDVAVRQPVVRVVQEIKQLGAKLKLLSFRNPNVLEC